MGLAANVMRRARTTNFQNDGWGRAGLGREYLKFDGLGRVAAHFLKI